MVGIKAVTQTRDSSSDLVKLDALLAAIYQIMSCCYCKLEEEYIPRLYTYMMAT